MIPDISSPRARSGAAAAGSDRIRQWFARYKILALLFAVALIWLFFTVLTHGAFATPRNLSNLLRQMAISGMLACGMVFVIIAGEIDLSVGSLLGLLGGVAAILDANRGWPIEATIPVVLALGVLAGVFNGWLSTYRRVPSFIVASFTAAPATSDGSRPIRRIRPRRRCRARRARRSSPRIRRSRVCSASAYCRALSDAGRA